MKTVRGLSSATISRLKSVWEEDYKAFCQRDWRGHEIVYLWADGIYIDTRAADRRCVLVLIGCHAHGRGKLVHKLSAQIEVAPPPNYFAAWGNLCRRSRSLPTKLKMQTWVPITMSSREKADQIRKYFMDCKIDRPYVVWTKAERHGNYPLKLVFPFLGIMQPLLDTAHQMLPSFASDRHFYPLCYRRHDLKILTLQEVADTLQVSERTIRRLVNRGDLAGFKVGDRGQLRVKIEDLQAYLERQRVHVDVRMGTKQHGVEK